MNVAPVRRAIPGLPSIIYCIMLAAGLFCLPQAQGQEDPPQAGDAKPEKLFSSEETLTISLKAPWRDISRKEEVQDPYPATLVYTDDQGQTHNLPLTVERRGITRQRVCRFPPIKLRFDKEVVKNTLFRGQKSIKLVTHCDKGDRWEQYYIKEMLAYQIYNLITPRSFKVRPLAVTYIDSSNDSAEDPRFAFLIEDDSDVAKRNDLLTIDLKKTTPERLEPQNLSHFMLFEFMLGNVDWSVLSGPGNENCCHNAKLFGLDPAGERFVIPYDFDSSGLVDAPYAAPNESLPTQEVTQRLYRGFCVHNPELEAARQAFIDHEQEIYALIKSESRLNARNVKTATRYLEDFFKLIKDPKRVSRDIIGRCRK